MTLIPPGTKFWGFAPGVDTVDRKSALLNSYAEADEIKGLGDVVHRVAEVTGIKRIVGAIERKTGKPCGCNERRERLNTKYPI
jgi:hypothetical protein